MPIIGNRQDGTSMDLPLTANVGCRFDSSPVLSHPTSLIDTEERKLPAFLR